MDYYNKSVNNINNVKIELGNYHSRQKYATSSLDKIYSKSVNNDITFEEIDENIKQCYTNLQTLKNTFKKSKIGLIKSSIIKTNKNNCNNVNIDSLIKKFENNNKNNTIISRNNIKSSNSSKNLTDSYQKPIINIKNDLQNNNLLKYSNDNSYFSIINKFRPFSPSTSLNNSNRNFFNSPNNYIDKNNLLHNSFSNKKTFISVLQKYNDDNINKKKNKEILNQYQDIKKKSYKKFMSDNNLNTSSLNEDIDYKKKYNECLEQIENLKISLLDYEKNNRKLKETISSLTSILNNSNEEKNKNKIKELIKRYKKELNITNLENKKLKDENTKLINEIQVLSNENKDLSKKISVLIDVIKTRDNVISNLQKVQTLKTDSELSCFESIDDKTKVYRRKSLKDYSLDKDKKNKNKKHIEEIILKLPKYNRNGKIIEFPGKKFNYNELVKENEENKNKINMLNSKLKHYSLIQKKYEDMILNQQTKEDETISKNFISSSATPIQTILNEIKTEDNNSDNYTFNNSDNSNNTNLNIY